MDYQGNAKNQKRRPSPSTTGNASSSASGGEFEVFLSFCGKDTRKTFTDFLYNDLIDAGIRTFRDNEELHVGEKISSELLKAIEVSKISIPVFSKNYASSKWCLDELAHMVKCHTDTAQRQKILPIFYDVKPSDVRHQTGSFEQAFLNHKGSFDGTIVQGWKEALTKVGELKGWELKNETDGHEGELAKKVTTKVLIELKKNCMDVTENLVGIEDQVKEMEKLLNAYSDAVQIVGILGMGGIGKTTLAKVIYNQIFKRFEGCCFLSDVRSASKVVDLQNELCRKILKGERVPDIANVDEGCHWIEDTVCRKKVLIVLDDVDKKSQFDKLVKREWFDKKSAQGSKIIVTTRNKQVLTSIAVDSTYEPPLMEFNHSLHLFSKHAFRKDFPPEEYDTLSRKFVDTAAGLPLALEVIGSNLYAEKNKSDWQGILEKLEKIPDNEVQEKLKISYGALDYQQTQIFLDIACFFIGKEKRVATYMWDACKFYPAEGINALVLRSLIKITDDNKLWMHDQLRDMGRDIVCKENCAKPWERSRVWSCEDASETMERCKETQEHEALEVEAFKVKVNFKESDTPFPKEFGQLKRLRYLEVERERYLDLKVECEGYLDKLVSAGDERYVADFKHLFPELRWLKWHGLFSCYRVTNFHLKTLVILDLSRSSFRDFRESWNQIKMAKNLKVLNLSGCCFGFDQAPDFSTFADLEMLILKDCWDLDKIHPSIENVISLRVLDISRSFITELPNAIGNLKKLEEIHASDCWELARLGPSIGNLHCEELVGLNPSIGNLTSLRVLDISGCKKLVGLDPWIGNLTSLRVLNISRCEKLVGLDPSIGNLTSLRVLNISRCKKLVGLDPSIGNLTSLRVLDISHCLKLVGLDPWIGKLTSLRVLDISYCNSITKLPDAIRNLKKLEEINASYCYGWDGEFPDIRRLSSLKILNLKCTQIYNLPKGFCELTRLKTLDLSFVQPQSLPELPSSLTSLRAKFASMKAFPSLSKLKSLKELEFFECFNLVEIPTDIGKLSELKILRLINTSISTLPAEIVDLPRLKTLSILSHKLQSIQGLPSSLTGLFISGSGSMERLPDLSNLKNLSTLRVRECSKLMHIECLGKIESLTSLTVCKCNKLEEVDGLEYYESLRYLTTKGCKSLCRLSDLSNLGMLKKLDISYCRMLAEVKGLGFRKSLKVLNVSYCTSLERKLDLSNLKELQKLEIRGWKNLNVIHGFEELESLVGLDISYCKIKKSPDLSNLKELRELVATWCEKLTLIQGLGELKSLQALSFIGSSKLFINSLNLPYTASRSFLSRVIEDTLGFEFHEEDKFHGGSHAYDYKYQEEDTSHGGLDDFDTEEEGDISDIEEARIFFFQNKSLRRQLQPSQWSETLPMPQNQNIQFHQNPSSSLVHGNPNAKLQINPIYFLGSSIGSGMETNENLSGNCAVGFADNGVIGGNSTMVQTEEKSSGRFRMGIQQMRPFQNQPTPHNQDGQFHENTYSTNQVLCQNPSSTLLCGFQNPNIRSNPISLHGLTGIGSGMQDNDNLNGNFNIGVPSNGITGQNSTTMLNGKNSTHGFWSGTGISGLETNGNLSGSFNGGLLSNEFPVGNYDFVIHENYNNNQTMHQNPSLSLLHSYQNSNVQTNPSFLDGLGGIGSFLENDGNFCGTFNGGFQSNEILNGNSTTMMETENNSTSGRNREFLINGPVMEEISAPGNEDFEPFGQEQSFEDFGLDEDNFNKTVSQLEELLDDPTQ